MKHRINHRKFNRTSEHRSSMFKNMMCALINNENIKTTLPKAKELRPLAEKIITLGKRFQKASEGQKLHLRRLTLKKLKCPIAAEKVLTVLANRFQDRNGGYLRVVKAENRYGDNAPMAILSMVDFDPSKLNEAADKAQA